MRKIAEAIALCCFLAVASILSGCGGAPSRTLPQGFDPEGFQTKALTAFAPREGLPNFFHKLKTKSEEVRIAYFGGSITAQEGYRVYSREYLQQQYPDTRFVEINAAIGGTATDLGVFRCFHDVIVHKPDLVIIEFAVNDAGLQPLEIRRNLEGIIRQIWSADATTDILLLYLVTSANQEELTKDQMARSASVMEDVASWYGIPSVHGGYLLSGLLKQDRLVMKASQEGVRRVSGDELNIPGDEMSVDSLGRIPFAPDGVHPFLETGHRLYMRSIREALPGIEAAGSTPVRHSLGEKMVSDARDEVATVPMRDPSIHLSGPWKVNGKDDAVSAGFLDRSDEFLTFEPGSAIRFRFKGSMAAIYDLIGPEGGSLDITVDGGEKRHVELIDKYCTYHRLALLTLSSDLDPSKIHEVFIEVSDAPIDKPAILQDNFPDFDAHPEKYTPRRFFAGCLFVTGKMISD